MSAFAAATPGRLAPSGIITGTVRSVGASARPMGGVEVIARRDGLEHRTTSDDDGTFRLDGLPQGISRFEVRSDEAELAYPDWAVAFAFSGRPREVTVLVSDPARIDTQPPVTPEKLAVRDRRLARLERQMNRWTEAATDDYEFEVESW